MRSPNSIYANMHSFIHTLFAPNTFTRLLALFYNFFCTHRQLILLTFAGIAIGYTFGQVFQGSSSLRSVNIQARQSPPAVDTEDHQWEVECIESKCRVGRRLWYLIKWKGYPPYENTWQKKEDIHADLVANFEAKLRRGRRHCQIIEPCE